MNTEKPRADEVPPDLVDQCDRCRLRELTPIGKGVMRVLFGTRMKLCDRCCTAVFGYVLPAEDA